jgi:hypothetical protein
MTQAIDPSFSCTICGKTFRWKPEIAGKKGKCSCGAGLTAPANVPGANGAKTKVVVTTTVASKRAIPVSIPAKTSPRPIPRALAAAPVAIAPVVRRSVPPPPPPPAPAEPEEETYDIADGDLSGLDALRPSAEAIAAAERETPPVLSVQPIPAAPLEYQRDIKRPKVARADRIDLETGELVDPLRDFIAPAILLAAALAGIAAYVLQHTGASPIAELAISVAFGVMLAITMVKTFVLIMAAFPLSTYCDVNIGLLRTAIFKLGSTILFGDTALLWFITILQSSGMIEKKGSGSILYLPIYLLVLSVVYQLCFFYMFRVPIYDFRLSGVMAIINKVIEFLMTVVLIALLTSYALNHAPPTPAPYTIPARQTLPSISPNTPIIVQPNQPGPTFLDALITDRAKKNGFIEGYAWCRTGMADDAAKKLISDMYNAGSPKVFMGGFTMYAQFPDDPTKRSACMAVAAAFRTKYGLADNSRLNYQYAVVNLGMEQLNKLHHP